MKPSKKAWNKPETVCNFDYPWQYRIMKRIHSLIGSQQSFADWIEHYPWAMRFVEYAHENHHPIDYDRMKAAENALKKRF